MNNRVLAPNRNNLGGDEKMLYELFDLDSKPIYRLSSLSDKAVTYYENRNPYEHTEEMVLLYDGELCIERYVSESGPGYDTYQKFYLFSKDETKKLLEAFGDFDNICNILTKSGIRSFLNKCSDISYTEMTTNPYKDVIDSILSKRN